MDITVTLDIYSFCWRIAHYISEANPRLSVVSLIQTLTPITSFNTIAVANNGGYTLSTAFTFFPLIEEAIGRACFICSFISTTFVVDLDLFCSQAA